MRQLLIVILVTFGFYAVASEPGDLDYLVDDSQRPRFHPVERGLPEAISRDALIAAVDPHDESPWEFGWFVYGDANSRSVAVGICDTSPAELFVDLNRDKELTPEERIQTETPNEWTMTLGAEFLTALNDYAHVDRQVRIRRSQDAKELTRATLGVMSGSAWIGGQEVAVVRLDRNANGRWFDPDDRILLDTDGDGQVNPIGGRIACDAVCRFNRRRYVIQSDATGEWLEMIELTGTGFVVPQMQLRSSDALIQSIKGYLASNSGVRVAVTGLDKPIECPVGDYRLDSLDLEVRNDEGIYTFRFSGLRADKHPIQVTANSEFDFDLLSSIQLTHSRSQTSGRTADVITVTPMLRTESGLYLINSQKGSDQAHLENRLLAEARVGDDVFANHSTGFS